MTPLMRMYGAKKDISKFRAFFCQTYMYLDSETRAKGKHIPRAVETINLGFAAAHNISGYKLFIPSTRENYVIKPSAIQYAEISKKQAGYNRSEQDKEDSQTNIMSRAPSGATWVQYDT